MSTLVSTVPPGCSERHGAARAVNLAAPVGVIGLGSSTRTFASRAPLTLPHHGAQTCSRYQSLPQLEADDPAARQLTGGGCSDDGRRLRYWFH